MPKTRMEYTWRAHRAYDEYIEIQKRITAIEVRAKQAHGAGVAAHRLRHAEEYWLYRDLVNDRRTQLEICHVNAVMAALPYQVDPVPPNLGMTE